jgi:hypothetical protein
MTDQKNNSNLELDAFFAAAKRSVPTPSETLKDKILQDAQQWETHTPVRSQKAWWLILFEDIGGFPSAIGYGTAAIFGLFVGFSAPDWSSFGEQFVYGTTSTQIEFTDPFAGLDLSYLEG